MIIQCKSCFKRFIVKDNDIPKEGRLVQCGYCSVKWHQIPVLVLRDDPIEKPLKKITEPDVVNKNKPHLNELKASDGKTYKFLGSQWAQLMPSGKTGIFATKKIGRELNKLIGRETKTSTKKIQLSSNFDPSSQQINTDINQQVPDLYSPKKGMGFFGYIFLIIIIFFSIIGIMKTFENDLINYFPEYEYIFELINKQIIYIAETIKNIIVIVKDLINSY